MGLIKRVSRTEPCPICGKPDYCFWKEREKEPDMYNLYCNRSSEAPGVIVTGIDGNEYVSIYEQSRGTIYESVTQREERRKEIITGEKKEMAPRQYTVLDSITPLPNEQLDSIYRSIMRHLPLYKFHAQYLLHETWNMFLSSRKNKISATITKRNSNQGKTCSSCDGGAVIKIAGRRSRSLCK